MKSFTSGEFDRVELIYNQFKNAAVQNLTNEAISSGSDCIPEKDKSRSS